QRAQESASDSANELEKERLREELRKLERDRDVQIGLIESRVKGEKEKLEGDLSGLRAKVEETEAQLRHAGERAQLAEAKVAELEARPPVVASSEGGSEREKELEEQIEELNAQMEELVAETGELSAAETIAMSRAARAERVVSEQTQTIEGLRQELSRLQQAMGEKRDSAGSAAEVSGEREQLLAQQIQKMTEELEAAKVGRRDAEEAVQQNQGKLTDLGDQLEVLKLALEEKDNEFQVIADALVEAEEAAAQLEREKQSLSEAGSAALREENERLTEEMTKLRQALSAAERKEGARDNVESALHSRDKEIEELQAEVQRLQSQVSTGGATGAGGNEQSGGRVAELEAELALSQRKLSRLEQTIIRLKGRG
ncbi:MAG: hypothetical protein KC800_06790, partial [Candidatus Eremiobacteraeota bacterium]|nr:hypothetical protein [Candidatus Eremiobacteraeota bacterium]